MRRFISTSDVPSSVDIDIDLYKGVAAATIMQAYLDIVDYWKDMIAINRPYLNPRVYERSVLIETDFKNGVERRQFTPKAKRRRYRICKNARLDAIHFLESDTYELYSDTLDPKLIFDKAVEEVAEWCVPDFEFQNKYDKAMLVAVVENVDPMVIDKHYVAINTTIPSIVNGEILFEAAAN